MKSYNIQLEKEYKGLKKREKDIAKKHFGMGMSYREISDGYPLTAQRIIQIVHQIVYKTKKRVPWVTDQQVRDFLKTYLSEPAEEKEPTEKFNEDTREEIEEALADLKEEAPDDSVEDKPIFEGKVELGDFLEELDKVEKETFDLTESPYKPAFMKKPFETNDLGCSAALLSHGLNVKIKKDMYGKATFVFEDENATEYAGSYWNNKLDVKAHTFFNSIRTLKTMMHDMPMVQ